MRCHFCFKTETPSKLTKEHLLSQPVAEAFRLDRASSFGQLGGPDDPVVLSRLDDVTVRSVCERCNNTWMNSLEHNFAKVAEWTRHPHSPLTADLVTSVQAWSLKTYVVLSAMVGQVRRFADNPQAPGVIPNFTRARQLFEGDDDAFEGMAFGLARPIKTDQFAYVFGNPIVVPQGERYANRKSAGVAIVSLGALQVWVVDPTLFRNARIAFPKGVRLLGEGINHGDLRGMPLVPRLDSVTVDNGEHDIIELFERLIANSGVRPVDEAESSGSP